MEKVKLTAAQIVEAKTELKKIAQSPHRDELIAKKVGEVYDVEMPVADVISSILVTDTVEVGEDFDYLAPEDVDKELYILTTNCTVTQTKVTPSTENELSFTDLISPEYYVCIHDLLKGKHNVLTLKSEAILEAMDRQEIYAVMQLLSTAATSKSNVFSLDSGKTKFDFPKLQEMKSALRKYGSKFVLISGANVTDDIELMDYDSDKQREHSIFRIVDEWFPVEDVAVDVDGSAKTVIGANEAYLVAVSDSKTRKPGYFVRRKTLQLADVADTESVEKERVIITGGNMFNVTTARKFSKSVAGFQEYGAIIVNANTIAKFNRS